MSYVDTFDHELVGFFAGLPLYHPLEYVKSVSPSEFGCDPSQLILGGGDGEHPAIIIKRLEILLFIYFQYITDRFDLENSVPSSLQNLLFTDYDLHDCFEFAGWEIEDYKKFYDRCNSVTFISPYSLFQEMTLLLWLALSIGEFVCLSMPELLKDLAIPFVEPIKVLAKPFLYNVLIVPPGYKMMSGRKTIMGKVEFGNYRWSKS